MALCGCSNPSSDSVSTTTTDARFKITHYTTSGLTMPDVVVFQDSETRKEIVLLMSGNRGIAVVETRDLPLEAK
jgi:hypothetical protein